jgi:hypothetical protein
LINFLRALTLSVGAILISKIQLGSSLETWQLSLRCSGPEDPNQTAINMDRQRGNIDGQLTGRCRWPLSLDNDMQEFFVGLFRENFQQCSHR